MQFALRSQNASILSLIQFSLEWFKNFNSRHNCVQIIAPWMVNEIAVSVVAVKGVWLLGMAVIMTAAEQVSNLVCKDKLSDGVLPPHNSHHL